MSCDTTLVCRLGDNWLSESGIECVRVTLNWDKPWGQERVNLEL